MSALNNRLRAGLELKDQQLLLRKVAEPGEASTVGNGPGIDFYTNDYLSLIDNPELKKRFLTRINKAKVVAGSGGSRAVINDVHTAGIEAKASKFFGSEAALLFNSGYDGNIGFFSCIPGSKDIIIYDERVHASMHDGMRASKARKALYPFKHNNMKSLIDLLDRLCDEVPGVGTGEVPVWIAVESLYSMSGTIAPLDEICDIVDWKLPKGNGHVYVDEAHSTGAFGENGRGLVCEFGVEKRVTAVLHVLGKAWACNGSLLLVSPLIRSYLINYSRPFIFTTNLGHAPLTVIESSLSMFEDGSTKALSEHLFALYRHLVSSLRPHLANIDPKIMRLPADLEDKKGRPSVIVPVITSKSRILQEHLQKNGFLVPWVAWPTVPKNEERVRVSLHAGNTFEQVDQLVDTLVKWGNAKTAESRKAGVVEEARL